MLVTAKVKPTEQWEDDPYEAVAHQLPDGTWQPWWEKDDKPDIQLTHNTDSNRFATKEDALKYAAYRIGLYFAGEDA